VADPYGVASSNHLLRDLEAAGVFARLGRDGDLGLGGRNAAALVELGLAGRGQDLGDRIVEGEGDGPRGLRGLEELGVAALHRRDNLLLYGVGGVCVGQQLGEVGCGGVGAVAPGC